MMVLYNDNGNVIVIYVNVIVIHMDHILHSL